MINVDDRLLELVNDKEYWLLTKIAKRIGSNSDAWPSLSTLSGDTGYSKPTVIKVINSLIEKGLISKESRKRRDGSNTSNIYRILTRYIYPYNPDILLEKDYEETLDSGSKENLQGVVKEIDKGSKGDLPGVVKEIDNIRSINNIEVLIIEEKNNKKRKNNSDLIALFDEFRKSYPGSKRGLETEFENFKKKNRSKWKEVIHSLMTALNDQKKHRDLMQRRNEFVPPWPMFQTWINQKRWEIELPPIDDKTNKNKGEVFIPKNAEAYKKFQAARKAV